MLQKLGKVKIYYSLRTLQKWLVPCTAAKMTSPSVKQPEQTKNASIAATSRPELSDTHFPTLTESESSLVGDEFFSTLQPISPHTSRSLFSFHGRYLVELHSLISPLQTFTATIPHQDATYTQFTHFLSLCSSLEKNKFHFDSFFLRDVAMWNRHPRRCFPHHDNEEMLFLHHDNPGSTIIYRTYTHHTVRIPHNMQPLLPSYYIQ